jgi:PPOX class probable F420-dependent enzyme
MRLDVDEARARFARARVARLATITPTGRPHLVPITFALAGDTIYTAVDAKPKSTTALQRLANIAAHPGVAVLADHYTEDWTQLWWARADGTARVLEDAAPAVDLLAARYAQYRDQPPRGPTLAIAVARWSGWSATGSSS